MAEKLRFYCVIEVGLSAQLDSHCVCVCVVQLREELLRVRQTHCGELDGMRKEVSRLTGELHRRDLAIASMEAERVEQNTGELKVGQPLCDPGC